MPHPHTLSVIIITKNEAANIEACIRSAQPYAEEIIVVDCGSTDGTQEICRNLGAKLFETDWAGDGPQKNRGLDMASGEWRLVLDADERISPGLGSEIAEIVKNGAAHTAFRIPRKSLFCGRFMKHSGWWPDYVIRLIRYDGGRYSEHKTHGSIQAKGSVGTLRHPFIHLTMHSLYVSLDKLNRFSTGGAEALTLSGHKGGLLCALAHGSWMFFRTYILKLGFLDGKRGFILAVLNAEGSYYKYLKTGMKFLPSDPEGSWGES